ncbi:MAG: DUF2889 domain-containing protein [Proteobacteria bacterium]|nr:DUF2889 domain-containing protein [Pseudomonadota bacterium]
MPLSPPTRRQHWHLRQVECRGYARDDGLYDVEAHLVDSKTYDFDSHDRGRVAAGEPVHDMWLRLTVDDGFRIRDAEAVTDAGPYRLCAEVGPNFARLKGLTIGPGFHRKVRELLGGVEGCTHLVELLGPLATTAFQTLVRTRMARDGRDDPGFKHDRPPAALNSCHAYRTDREVVKRLWPAFYTGPGAPKAKDPA